MFPIKKGKFSQGAAPRRIKREEQELEQAFEQVTRAANGELDDDFFKDVPTSATVSGSAPSHSAESGSVNRNKKIAIIAVSVVAAVLILCIGIGTWFYLSTTADNGLIMDNIYAAGIDIGGMTPEGAKAALHEATDDTYTSQSIIIEFPDKTLELSPADTKASLNVELLVDAAYNLGREGSRGERMSAMAEAKLTSKTIDLFPYMTLDTGFIQTEIENFHKAYTGKLTQPTVAVEGERPSFPIPEGADVYVDPEDPGAVDYTEEAHQTLIITLGTQGRDFDADALVNQVLDAYNQNVFDPIAADCTVEDPEKADLNKLVKEYCSEPTDAVIDEKDYSVKQEVWGYGFDLVEAKKLFSAAKPGDEIRLTLHYIRPKLIKAELDATLFRDVLATADTEYYYNPPRTNNIRLVCEAINGTILKPGEVFSFNGTVGERTEAKGYQAAAAYIGGETVDDIGGGICQVASTLYYCTLHADLEVVDRIEHMFSVDYVPLGMDATVNWGTIDYAFRNNTNYPMRIEAKAEDGYVHISFIGTDEKDYYVEMDYEIIKTLDWKTVEKQMDADNEKGYVDGDVVTYPYTGYVVDTYMYKYDKETDVLLSTTYIVRSQYDARDRVVCRIDTPTEAPTTPPTTEETDPPETDPPETDPPETDPPIEDSGEETQSSEGDDSLPDDSVGEGEE